MVPKSCRLFGQDHAARRWTGAHGPIPSGRIALQSLTRDRRPCRAGSPPRCAGRPPPPRRQPAGKRDRRPRRRPPRSRRRCSAAGIWPSARASSIASARPKPCVETPNASCGRGRSATSKRRIVPGRRAGRAGVDQKRGRGAVEAARAATVASPSCSSTSHRPAAARRAASAPRRARPRRRRGRDCRCRSTSSALRARHVSAPVDVEPQEVRRAGDAGIVVAHGLLAAMAQRLVRQVEEAADIARSGPPRCSPGSARSAARSAPRRSCRRRPAGSGGRAGRAAPRWRRIPSPARGSTATAGRSGSS